MTALHINVLPSAIEAFGISYLEALAARIPVIGLKSAAVPEIVKHNVNGFLVNPLKIKDQKNNKQIILKPNKLDLVNSICIILKKDEIYKKMRKECLSTAVCYDWSIVVKEYLKLIGR